jgi:hypothetical protein
LSGCPTTPRRTFSQANSDLSGCLGAPCKTVGLAYPGSNPGPATTSCDVLELAKLSSRPILPRAAGCGSGCPYAARCAQYVPNLARCRSASSARPWHVLVLARHGGFLDAPLGFVLLPGDALRECLPREPAGQMRESGESSTGHNRETAGRANDYPRHQGLQPGTASPSGGCIEGAANRAGLTAGPRSASCRLDAA